MGVMGSIKRGAVTDGICIFLKLKVNFFYQKRIDIRGIISPNTAIFSLFSQLVLIVIQFLFHD
jgi:hypothetical protein